MSVQHCEGSGQTVSITVGHANGNTIGWPTSQPVCHVCDQALEWADDGKLPPHDCETEDDDE